MNKPHLNIICYKWGTMYTSEEVNILRAMVQRNLSLPHRFFCITDDATGLASDIEAREMPPHKLPGNGPKIWTFSSGFLGLEDDAFVVSLDIDLVIVGSLDWLADNPDEPFLIAPHRASKANARCHGAVYRLKAGSKAHVWDNFIADPWKAAADMPGVNRNAFSEQLWLDAQLPGDEMRFLPENKVILFRKDCHARAWTNFLGRNLAAMGLTAARWGKARLPGKGEAIVSFAGTVNPRDVRDSHFGHLKQAPFVKEHWRN